MPARRFAPEFQKRVVLEFEAGDKKAAQICREYEISDSLLTSALFRQESRGGHYRQDFPKTSPDWKVHTLIQGNQCRRSAPITLVD